MCVEDEGVEAIVLCDLGGDVDGALVRKLAAKFEVVKGEGVVRGFGPACVSVAILKRD